MLLMALSVAKATIPVGVIQMKIRRILAQDVDVILELNEKSVKVLSPMDNSKLQRLIEQAALALVVEQDKQVAGFLLAFTSGITYESVNYQWFNQHYDAFLYIDRIVVAEQFRGRGIASAFYQYTLEWASKHKLPRIFAEIDLLPPNEASLLFHQKFGFKELALLQHSENKKVSLQELQVN